MEYTSCFFAAYLADSGLAPSTVNVYLTVVRNMQLSLGLPKPRDQSSLTMIKRILGSINCTHLTERRHSRVQLPITGSILIKMHPALLQSGNPDKTLIWAICSQAFFSFCLGKLLVGTTNQYHPVTCLSWGDVAVYHFKNHDQGRPQMFLVQPGWKGRGCHCGPYQSPHLPCCGNP